MSDQSSSHSDNDDEEEVDDVSEASFLPSDDSNNNDYDDDDDDDYSDDNKAVSKKTKKTKTTKNATPMKSPSTLKTSKQKQEPSLSTTSSRSMKQDQDNATQRKRVVTEKNHTEEIKPASPSRLLLSSPSTYSSKKPKPSSSFSSTTKSPKRTKKDPGSLYQSNGYDIVLPPSILEHVSSHPNNNVTTLLIQIDATPTAPSTTGTSTSTTSTSTSKSKTNHPPTLRMTSGSVIGRLEWVSPPPMNTTASGGGAAVPQHPTHNRIKFDYGGTEYMGQIYPGPTAMILSLCSEPQEPELPPAPSGRDDATTTTAVSVAVKIEHDCHEDNQDNNKVPATVTSSSSLPNSSSNVLIVDHIVNEFCNMIPVAAAAVTTKGSNRLHSQDGDDDLSHAPQSYYGGIRSTASANVDYFQYSDDIYDVNKVTKDTFTAATSKISRDDDDGAIVSPRKKKQKSTLTVTKQKDLGNTTTTLSPSNLKKSHRSTKKKWDCCLDN